MDQAELARFNEAHGYGVDYTDLNSKIIDSWVDEGWEWSVPITHEEFERARSGDFRIFLTPTKPVPAEWFGDFYQNARLTGADVLGLASGGAQQMPILAALGANCTVLDYAQKQLDSEKMVADREGYDITIVKADMTKRLPFEDESFDIIVHPVSNCYIEDVQHVWNECFRVLRPGGTLLAGVDNGVNFLLEEVEGRLVATTKLPFNPLKNPDQYEMFVSAGDGIQFSHTMEEQLGGQLKAGFRLVDLYEDRDAAGPISEHFPQYLATRAVKEL
ncbi:class I SAM-dependent methyltransferase [Oscillospiraceae bacterium OttesenSCG-928-F05]|nr:class I SAM-dependent methyltransferase [Oscillospiraceae bacterium OttesenSCG-928-F05]